MRDCPERDSHSLPSIPPPSSPSPSPQEEKGGRHFRKLGFADVNLSEYAGSGPTTQRYILQPYDRSHRLDNSIVRITVNVTLREGDTIFRRPLTRQQPIEEAAAAAAAAGADSFAAAPSSAAWTRQELQPQEQQQQQQQEPSLPHPSSLTAFQQKLSGLMRRLKIYVGGFLPTHLIHLQTSNRPRPRATVEIPRPPRATLRLLSSSSSYNKANNNSNSNSKRQLRPPERVRPLPPPEKGP